MRRLTRRHRLRPSRGVVVIAAVASTAVVLAGTVLAEPGALGNARRPALPRRTATPETGAATASDDTIAWVPVIPAPTMT